MSSAVWSQVGDLDATTQDRLAQVLETRGADLQQRAMRRAFLADIVIPAGARALDIGCGTGVLTRLLARWPNVGDDVGADLASGLLARVRELAPDLSNLTLDVIDPPDTNALLQVFRDWKRV